MKIRYRKDLVFYQITIIAAVFSDVLRVKGTPLSFFRMLLPIALLKCYVENYSSFVSFVKVSVISFVINMFQAIGFWSINDLGIPFFVTRFLEYQLLYVSIFALCLICNTLYLLYGTDAKEKMYDFILSLSWVILFVFVFIAIVGNGIAIKQYGLSNVNNYAVYIAAAIPFHLFRKNRRRIDLAFVLASFLLFVYNDCSIVLFGSIIEIVLYLLYVKRLGKFSSIVGVTALAGSVMLLLYSIENDVPFLSQNIGLVFKNVSEKLVNNELYNYSNTSITYRVNVLIMGVRWLFKSFFLGIGTGNSALVMTKELSSYRLYSQFTDGNVVALHNGPLEILLDYGFLGVLFFIWLGKRVVAVIRVKEKGMYERLFLTVFLSSLVWILAPSGITSTFFVYVVFSYLINLKPDEAVE